MTARKDSEQQPLITNATLMRLDALAGDWEIQFSKGEQALARARTTFEWLEGGAFLIQHADHEPALPDAPSEWRANLPMPITAIIGLDDSSEQFSMLYADARGVYRIYQMRLDDGIWELWRDAPEFPQRFTATFSDDGNAITGQWEYSNDGINWEHDFDVTYSRISGQ